MIVLIYYEVTAIYMAVHRGGGEKKYIWPIYLTNVQDMYLVNSLPIVYSKVGPIKCYCSKGASENTCMHPFSSLPVHN